MFPARRSRSAARFAEPGSAKYPPIAEYALLADCHSAALVHREGSIDWACLRRFDAGSVFARLLDWDHGGHFTLAVSGGHATRSYVEDTLVLETRWQGPGGAAVVQDAFAMRAGGRQAPRHELLRTIECTDGQVEVLVRLEPRFDYGDLRPWLRDAGDGRYVAIGGDDALLLVSDAPLAIDRRDSRLAATVPLVAGRRLRFSLLSQPAHAVDLSAIRIGEVDTHLDETVRWWRQWSADTRVPDTHGDVVRRSACVLKGLTCAPTGAIVAAPTTSLPEDVGGERNWDYRYCWVRDATLTLQALSHAGHREVASGFRHFLMRATAGHAEDLQIMYGAYGERRLPEQELDLAGYRGSRPVRIGNRASRQSQLDVFGHILDAAYLWQSDGAPLTPDEWRFLRQVVDQAARVWRQRDAGIWEVRGPPRHFVHSKVMLWVALDRGIRLAEAGAGGADDEADVAGWRAARAALRDMIESRGVAANGGYFTQELDAETVDAALLKLPALGFVDARDPRMLATTREIRHRLGSPEGFVRRYETNGRTVADPGVAKPAADRLGQPGNVDGLGGREGTFLLCSFWLVEVLAMQGAIDEAQGLFDRLLRAGNDLGLFAEEFDVEERVALGNFPQAFTHLSLIQAAFRLDEARR